MRFKLLNFKFYFFHTFKCDLQLSPRYKLKVAFSVDNYAPLRRFLIKKILLVTRRKTAQNESKGCDVSMFVRNKKVLIICTDFQKPIVKGQ